jgi:hypothetical protein
VALEQIAGLRVPCEQRQTLPHAYGGDGVRGATQATLEWRTTALHQRAKDLGAELGLLRWEQREGWLPAARRIRLLGPRALPSRPARSRNPHHVTDKTESARANGPTRCCRELDD